MTGGVDTIAAVATPPGLGAIAVIRISGPASHEILRALTPDSGGLPPVGATKLLTLADPETGEKLDQAVVARYASPASYTGEDLVELSCHGGWLAPALVLEACVGLGARRAEPGEFTRRAYLNGKMDLVQAEAVADLVTARSRALHRTSIAQLERGLSERVGELRRSLLALEAVLAHHIDFPEEDDAPVPGERIAADARALVARLDAMLATAPEGRLLREGALAVLAGAPNSGKSSLYNALIGEDRAIVTEVPGTTRDALDTGVQIGGYPFRLVDTAGLRETDDRVERIGVEVARRYLSGADLVLLCVDASRRPGADERQFLSELTEVPVVLLRTKADLHEERSGEESLSGCVESVRVSVVTGEGLDRLRELLPSLVFTGLVEGRADVPVLTRERQARAMRSAREEVEAFARGMLEGTPPEIAATHLRRAEECLEELLGVMPADEVLGAVFSEFCVGK